MLTKERASPLELMANAKAGDLDAFGELYGRYRQFIAAHGEKCLPGQGDDIAQDTFVRALRNLHGWHDQGYSPLSWLKAIAHRIVLDRIRSRYNQRVQPVADVGADVAAPDWQANPEQLVLEHLTRVDVIAALLALTEDQRDALVAFHFRGLRIAAIADEMGRSTGAVKALMYKGRAAMARRLAHTTTPERTR